MAKEQIGIYYCITTIIDNIKHYYCRVYNDPATGVPLIEWDTDTRFASRFKTEVGATNFITVVIKTDGCKVELHPGNVKPVKVN